MFTPIYHTFPRWRRVPESDVGLHCNSSPPNIIRNYKQGESNSI